MVIHPESVTPNDMYRLLTACVIPRPIAWVTTVAEDGTINAAPFSFFNAVSSDPPIVMISVERRMGEPKDTARNIHNTREFVVNIVNEQLAEKMNITAGLYPRTTSEIELAGLSLLPGLKLRTPRIGESPISLECSVLQWTELGKGPTDLIFGEVLSFHIRDEVFAAGNINFKELKAIGRLAGNSYCRTTDIFEMKRERKSS